jgi:hypothetical protein
MDLRAEGDRGAGRDSAALGAGRLHRRTEFSLGEDAPTERVLANNVSDAIFHLATGVLFAAVAAIQLGLDRSASS